MPEINRGSMQAFGLAFLIELAIVVGAAAILAGMQAKSALSEPVPITLTELPPEEKPPEPKPEPPPPLPQPKIKPLVKQIQPRPPTPLPPPEAPPVAAPIAAVPTAFTQPAPPAPPPSPPPSSSKADAQATYAARVKAAIQAIHSYPAAAAAIRFSGRTQVEFHLRDGILVDEPRMLTSCGIGVFDKLALQSAQMAHYPTPPEELRGDNTKITVWVEFIGR